LLLVASRLSVAMLDLDQVSWGAVDHAWTYTHAHEALMGQARAAKAHLQTATTAAMGKRVTRDASSPTQTLSSLGPKMVR
jgi:hypothetical protein